MQIVPTMSFCNKCCCQLSSRIQFKQTSGLISVNLLQESKSKIVIFDFMSQQRQRFHLQVVFSVYFVRINILRQKIVTIIKGVQFLFQLRQTYIYDQFSLNSWDKLIINLRQNWSADDSVRALCWVFTEWAQMTG
ncbi:Hypothetical_protein [Hexamita inflata]|uniref:Hypothetical_protein n=1 Tax=Hexamita inflata TaxID=28002 RepID=A0AA86U3E1_9EUKA|nr:Hypothetical protein HINF_LOCUS28335 [Hexamita inflata]